MECVERINPAGRCPQVDQDMIISQGYKWIPSTVSGGLPPLALSVGREPDGKPIYVGRADHNGCTVPVKIVPEKQSAHITVNGANIFVHDFEILCGSGFRWIRSANGHISSKAVSYQKSTENDALYIGRAHHGEGLIPGKIDPAKGCLFISTEEGEKSYISYDVLEHDHKLTVGPNRFDDRSQWIHAASDGPVPAGAVRAGHDSDGTVIYVGRVNHEGNTIPAKIIPAKKMAHTQHNGQEIGKSNYEAFCNAQVSWIPFRGRIPGNAVSCGRLINGEQVFIGRGSYMGSLTPGKVLRYSNKLYIPYRWNEVKIDEFEILIYNENHGDDFDAFDDPLLGDEFSFEDEEISCGPKTKKKVTWLPCKNYQEPPVGVVLVGYDSDRSPIYLGRVMYEGNQLPAKVIPSKQLCHTQHNGEEIEMISYEALCYGNADWVRFRGSIPTNALVCGRLISGEAVYIGRGRHLDSLTPGMVLASEKVLCIPFGWKEIKISNFEILIDNDFNVCSKKQKWIHTKREQPAPNGAIIAGQDFYGSPIYVGRVQHDGNRFVSMVIPSRQICDTTDESGKVISKLSYEALCDAEVSWVKFEGSIPTEAVECGRDRHGGKVFIGRCYCRTELIPGTVLEAEKKLRFVKGRDMKVETNYEILVYGLGSN